MSPVDYSILALPKGKPKAIVKDERDRTRKTFDDKESDKVKVRSGGRCEVVVDGRRCNRRASEVHHLLGGHGVRGRGESAKADRKQHACGACHSAITSHRIQRLGPAMPKWTVRYRSVK